jgi:pyruvate,water dikinase
MNEIRTFDQIRPTDLPLVGGKGLGLARLANAGLPVPDGFCITTQALHDRAPNSPAADSSLAAQIRAAYQRLGPGPVAVRSSAVAEDGAQASFAGQQETILGVNDENALFAAITRCCASLDSARGQAYRERQGLEIAEKAMAVVVQRLVNSEVSGVLFTSDPLDPEGRRMLVEASWGLGESIVSGRVSPDRYSIDRVTGAVHKRLVNTKTVMTTLNGMAAVPTEKQNSACLDQQQLTGLAALGRQVEAVWGAPRDIEWAWAEGQFWLLQARPITTAGAAERELVRQQEIATLAARADPRGTVWSRFNLSEVLPTPTPMTWAIVQRLLSGRGGFGMMYRDFGCQPDRSLDQEGVFDLVCGRPYCNLSREPAMQYCGLPTAHSFQALKAAPQHAMYAVAGFDPSGAGASFWFTLPMILIKLFRMELRLTRFGRTLAPRLQGEVFPTFSDLVEREQSSNIERDDFPTLLEKLEKWQQWTLVDFARESLKPTALAAVAMAKLKAQLSRHLGPERTQAAIGELTMGVRPDPEADLAAAIRLLAVGELDRPTLLSQFGHRGNQEMELAEPRWTEAPATLESLLLDQGDKPVIDVEDEGLTWERIAGETKLTGSRRKTAESHWHDLRQFLGLRETGKHYFMKGYAVIRRILVELDRRYNLNGGIFFLTPAELRNLESGTDVSAIIASRRRRRKVALSIDLPSVLFSDDLEAIGRPSEILGADLFKGVPLSAGVGEGMALVLTEPTAGLMPAEPYVLVCPSTDPAWVPLFVNASGLVMETGGILSHGAIVAREFGLPAVAGIPDVCRRIRSGQRLRVDGGMGRVVIQPSAP